MKPHERSFGSLDEFYSRGPFTSVVAERRAASPASARMFMLRPPPGNYPKPPTPDFNLVLTIGSPHRVNLDLGAGRWRKLTVRGDMGLQPANAAADIVDDDAHQILIVSMPERVVLDRLAEQNVVLTDFGALHASTFTDSLVEELCLRMWREAQEGGSLGSLFVDTGVTLLVALLARLAERSAKPLQGRGGLPPQRLKRVIDYIHGHLDGDLRLDELATASGLSASHFVRSFRAEMGMSPHRYVVEARVEHARQLLERSQLPVADIARLCGFSSTGHLAAWFKRLTGLRPSEYRQF